MVADGNSADAPIHAIARFHGRDLMRIREGEPVAERDHHGDRPEEDAPAEGRTAEELTPDTGKPVSKLNLGRFGAGFIFFCIVFMMSGTICWCLCGIGTVLLLPRELSAATADAERFDIRQIAMQFRPPTKGARDFYLALVGRLMLIFGYNMIVGYQLYVCMKYIGQDAKAAASTMSTMAVITMVVPLVVPLVSGPISDRIGKRKLPVFVSSTIIAIGIAVPWVLKSQFSMFVYAALMGLGYGIYMVVDQALNVDVLPNPNEAGKALGILNLANTLGQVIAPIVVSSIVVATGGYFLVFPIAIAAVTIGAVVILFIKKVK